MKARHHVPKKIIFFSVVSSLLAVLYLQFGLLPGDLKSYAVEQIELQAPIRIEFSKILYLPWRGLSLSDVRVMERSGAVIFSAKNLIVDVRIIPFFKEKKIIISKATLEGPLYDYVLKPKKTVIEPPPPKTKISGQITVPVVPNKKKIQLSDIEDGANAFLPENVYLEQINIIDGQVAVRETPDSPVIEEIHDIDIRMGFQKPPVLTFDGSISLGHERYAHLELRGRWNLDEASYEFRFLTKTEKIPSWFLEYQKNHFLVLKEGKLQFETNLKSIHEREILFNTKADLREASIAIKQGLYEGRMQLETTGIFNFESQSFPRYKGILNLIDVQAHNVSKTIDHLEKLQGRMEFQPGKLFFEEFKGQFKKLPFHADGELTSFKDLVLDLRIRTESSIEQLLALIPPEHRTFLTDLELQGDCQALTHVEGSLKKSETLSIDHQILLSGGSIKHKKKKWYASAVNGSLSIKPDSFAISGVHFLLSEKRYSLDAYFPKKSGETGKVALKSSDFQLSSSYTLDGQVAHLSQASLNVQGIQADFKGTVRNLDNPYVDVEGNAYLDIERALKTPLKSSLAESLGLRGHLKGFFIYKGFWKHIQDGEFGIDATGEDIFVKKNLPVDDVQVQIRMKDGVLNVPFIRGFFYNGTVGGESHFDLRQKPVFMDGRFYANKVNLQKLAQDVQLNDKELSGLFSLQMKLNGILSRPETFVGDGQMDIQSGHIWKTDQFKKMGELVIVKVEGLDMVTFTEMACHFDVHDKKIWTKDLRLKSATVDLSLEGNVGFDQKLDFLMDIRFSDDVILGAQDTGGIVPFVVQQAEGLISKYRVSGTLSAPKYEKSFNVNVLPVGKKMPEAV